MSGWISFSFTETDQYKFIQFNTSTVDIPSITLIPNELLYTIFGYLPQQDWFAVLLSCKWFYYVAKRAFDPSMDNQEAFRESCEKGLVDCVKSLLLGTPSFQTNLIHQILELIQQLMTIFLLKKLVKLVTLK